MGHTSCWGGLEDVWLLLWWTGPAVQEESHFLDQAEYLLLSPGEDPIAQNTPQPLWGAPTGKKEANILYEQNTELSLNAHTHTLTVHTHLVLLQFSFQAVKAIENKVLVQLIVGITDKSPNCFSFRVKLLPGAQSCLKMMKKQQNNVCG